MSKQPPKRVRGRSRRLLETLRDRSPVIIITHDNPDPDGIASGWALATLLSARLNRTARLVAGGAVVRAENARLIELLEPPLELVDSLDPEPEAALVFVDCEPSGANHILPPSEVNATAVIDHHEQSGRRPRVPFRDIKPKLAASAVITSCYLREQGVEPDANLATALLYAIQADAVAWPSFTRTDHRMVVWLSERADLNKLADIQSAPLAQSYYSDLALAIENTFIYDSCGLCFLPMAGNAEIVGEVADLLIRCRELNRVLCAAVINGQILLSVRAAGSGGDASVLVNRLLQGIGHGGGHKHRAGGKIAASSRGSKISEETQNELRNRWLSLCAVDRQRGTRLVQRKDILKNL